MNLLSSKDVEIERKFLLKELPQEVSGLAGLRIKQGYLNASKERTVRVRCCSDGTAFLTVKAPTADDDLVRIEVETPLDPIAAEKMLELREFGLVEKTRRIFEYNGSSWEVDEFHGDNSGLFIAEIELPRADAPISIPPGWEMVEVTNDSKYTNARLAKEPFSSNGFGKHVRRP